jgi:RNA polymerase sigma-70 factor (ECF subfamily)
MCLIVNLPASNLFRRQPKIASWRGYGARDGGEVGSAESRRVRALQGITAHNATMNSDLIALLPRLRCYARVLTGTSQQADKLVLETLARANERSDVTLQGMSLRTRMLAIMRALHLNKSTHPPQGPEATQADADEGAGGPWKSRADARRARAEPTETLGHFSRLPVAQREVLVLVAVERLSYDEIAILLGVSVATVIARLSSARESMRSMANASPTQERIAK